MRGIRRGLVVRARNYPKIAGRAHRMTGAFGRFKSKCAETDSINWKTDSDSNVEIPRKDALTPAHQCAVEIWTIRSVVGVEFAFCQIQHFVRNACIGCYCFTFRGD